MRRLRKDETPRSLSGHENLLAISHDNTPAKLLEEKEEGPHPQDERIKILEALIEMCLIDRQFKDGTHFVAGWRRWMVLLVIVRPGLFENYTDAKIAKLIGISRKRYYDLRKDLENQIRRPQGDGGL